MNRSISRNCEPSYTHFIVSKGRNEHEKLIKLRRKGLKLQPNLEIFKLCQNYFSKPFQNRFLQKERPMENLPQKKLHQHPFILDLGKLKPGLGGQGLSKFVLLTLAQTRLVDPDPNFITWTSYFYRPRTAGRRHRKSIFFGKDWEEPETVSDSELSNDLTPRRNSLRHNIHDRLALLERQVHQLQTQNMNLMCEIDRLKLNRPSSSSRPIKR